MALEDPVHGQIAVQNKLDSVLRSVSFNISQRTAELLNKRQKEKSLSLHESVHGSYIDYEKRCSELQHQLTTKQADLTNCVTEQEGLVRNSLSSIDELLAFYEGYSHTFLELYKTHAVLLQNQYIEEITNSEESYSRFSNYIETFHHAVQACDQACDSDISQRRSAQMECVQNTAIESLHRIALPKETELTTKVMAEEQVNHKKEMDHLVSHLKQLNMHVDKSKHAQTREADTLIADYTHLIRTLEESKMHLLNDPTEANLKGEKKYLLSSLQSLQKAMNVDSAFYNSRLKDLARNFNSAKGKLSKTSESLERIGRLYSLCERIKESLDISHGKDDVNTETEPPNWFSSRRFQQLDIDIANILLLQTQVETETKRLQNETIDIQEKLQSYYNNIMFRNPSPQTLFLSNKLQN